MERIDRLHEWPLLIKKILQHFFNRCETILHDSLKRLLLLMPSTAANTLSKCFQLHEQSSTFSVVRASAELSVANGTTIEKILSNKARKKSAFSNMR